jgi:hypothetical protein
MTLVLLRDDELRRTEAPDPAHRNRVDAGDTARLVCRTCGDTIASVDAVLPRGEAPLVFANPGGLVFELVLLRTARGLALVGPMTLEHTWFAGYAWRVALCAGCATHLGWRYQAVEPDRSPGVFLGLLRAELIETRG